VFQMINQTPEEPGDRKMLLVKIGMFIVALAALGGVVYFFAFVSMGNH
jgi:flagellar basal body-associated protein FliL